MTYHTTYRTFDLKFTRRLNERQAARHSAVRSGCSAESRAGGSLSITIQHTQEKLCFAHIYALAGVAGVNHTTNAHDYGVDGQFTEVKLRPNGGKTNSGYPLDFQAKASIDWELKDDRIVYDLEAKTYDDMVTREPSETTLMLILLCLPKTQAEWHMMTEDATTLRRCCYWHIEPPGPPCGNASTKRIYIPTNQLLTPDMLRQLLAGERQRRLSQSA